MKKKIFIFLFVLILINCMNVSYAFFPKSHIAWTVNGFRSVTSPITSECRQYLHLIIDGNSGSDAGVIHYGSSDEQLLGTYIFPHTRSGYMTCLEEAGADVEKRCMCYGNALHLIQDGFSHNVGGVTEKNLKKFLGSNYFGHMTVEKNFETKHINLLTRRNDYAIYSGQLDYYNSIFLNSFFPELGGNNKFLELMNDVAGMNMINDFRTIRSGYLGESFYSAVYKDKINLPWWAYGISMGLIILGLGMIIFMIFIGRTWWKWISIFLWLVIFLAGVIIIYSFVTGTTWKITTFVIEVPASAGYLAVSDSDVAYYDRVVQEATNQFLRDGQLPFDDASGLSYVDREGNWRVGALTRAERGFKYVSYFLIIPLLFALNLWLIFKSVGIKIFRRR